MTVKYIQSSKLQGSLDKITQEVYKTDEAIKAGEEYGFFQEQSEGVKAYKDALAEYEAQVKAVAKSSQKDLAQNFEALHTAQEKVINAGKDLLDKQKDAYGFNNAQKVIGRTGDVDAVLQNYRDQGINVNDIELVRNYNDAMGDLNKKFEELKNYFAGRPMTSRCVTLSRQVLSVADSTLSSYMSIAFDKLNMFNDEGLCALTSNTDIDPNCFADEKTALFLKIPDEKDTRHGLASMFILCIYKALIKKASAREDLSLPRNVYFILDEFGNMPQINKFDKMITVGRSRKIWFNMVVQSYAQLNNVYGDTVANIIKSNCGMKMFIGSNDIETCKEFSELCGNMTVTTASVSNGGQDKDISVSSQLQTRPLIYPSELQKLNNKQSTGNSIIVTFGNYPLKTQFTPSYQCPLYKIGAMDLTEARRNVFFGDEVYYDLGERNRSVLNAEEGREREA